MSQRVERSPFTPVYVDDMASTIAVTPAMIRSAQVTAACDSLRTQQCEADVKADLSELLYALGLFMATSRDD